LKTLITGLLNFFRRQPKRSPHQPGLREIWHGFQKVLSAIHHAQGVMGELEELLATPGDSTAGHWQDRLAALDHHMAAVVDTLHTMVGGKWPELEAARLRIQAALQEAAQRLSPDDPATLTAVTDLIFPLNLMDRRHSSFRPENCRTYHDIIRFAHETAKRVMFSLMDRVEQGQVPALRLLKLDTTLPLNLHLIDLGDGLASHTNPVAPEDILSVPMRALWRGISHPDITWAGPVPVNMGGFLHVLGQTAIRPPERFWDKTYAIVGAHYVNYACRLGFHFQSVDSYCGPVPEDNYINFTFKGGAADELRRIRRIHLIAQALTQLGLEVEIHQDMIRARFRKRSLAETEERLDLLGRLMAYVRQMDMLMSDDTMPKILAERFLAGHYERPGDGQTQAGTTP
jgi:pyruvate,water dikinase